MGNNLYNKLKSVITIEDFIKEVLEKSSTPKLFEKALRDEEINSLSECSLRLYINY